MSLVTHMLDNGNAKQAQDKDLSLNVTSSLYLDQIANKSNTINSLLMKYDSSLHNYASDFKVKNQAIINDNCRLKSSSIIIGTNCNITVYQIALIPNGEIKLEFKDDYSEDKQTIILSKNHISKDEFENYLEPIVYNLQLKHMLQQN